MNSKLAVVLAAAALVVPIVPLAAHHSFAAEYDSNKPVKFTGKVTKVEWTNPHARFYVETKDAAGNQFESGTRQPARTSPDET